MCPRMTLSDTIEGGYRTITVIVENHVDRCGTWKVVTDRVML